MEEYLIHTYDAAGRLVKKGEKTYEYGCSDKVMRVAEDGKELARFEYHNNNQLAKVVRENGIETFEWDGLALIERNGTKYINEPHAGGGNPILATTPAPNANSLTSPSQSQTIFTDMLGTSLGTVKNNAYSEIEKTAFGNLFSESAQPAKSLSSANTFFTGKPYVEDLGYIFLLRNYRADMGKWLSQDLIGYPDGWNNFAYCNNSILSCIDLYGADGINFITNPTVSGIQSDSAIYSGGNVLVKDNTGFYVIAHGDKNGISNTPTSGYIDFNKIVSDIKNAPGYNDYDTIELIACNTGEGDNSFAKKLAEALDKKVKAPTGEIVVHSNGLYYLKNGKYVTYE